ncbi:PQQ-dependent sugar dehydrogenase [Albimonas pacifica]|uniref:Glucose/arabinose dehydrogenase, beta-propeller fold n=1 Tax=Albimonas pacifica TaxID=1114924 RepID=A0A1I3EF86_9RHOB|nr:PQQ-dependent sugar dehydrogenase [Albimonas pacifica]SFH97655.1 Glucose/arabinose dehydrogenase, beta-propeller fold [Albimonas pacifica]
MTKRLVRGALRGAAAGTMLTACLSAGAAQAGRLDLAPVAGLDVESFVIDAVALPGQPDRIAMLEYSGRVLVVDRAAGTTQVMLEAAVVDGVDLGASSASGAFSIALAPDFADSGRFYLSGATVDRRNVVVEYASSGLVADPASQRRVATIEARPDGRPGLHYGGAISFDDAGMLFLTTGDSNGAFAGDAGPSQDVTSRLGKVLRIDPRGDAYPDDPANNYAIPAGNPDFGPGADPALWAIGLRNPFKGKHDPLSGLFPVADVGENAREEVNLIAPGGNYGWAAFEGSAPGAGDLNPEVPPLDPVFEYVWADSGARASITGGLVYHGPLAALDGRYLFSDLLGWGAIGEGPPVWSLAFEGGAVSAATLWETVERSGALSRTVGFGQDGAGRLYLFDQDGDVFEVASALAAPVPLPAAGLTLATGLSAGLGLLALRRRRPAPAGRRRPSASARR